MRACIVTADLGTAASRREGLLRSLSEQTGGATITATTFVGSRQSTTPGADCVVYRPHVEGFQFTTMRLANVVFRLADSGLLPRGATSVALSLCRSAFVEAVLACDPDVVLLDVRWGRYLKADLEREGIGPVYLTEQPASATPTMRPPAQADLDATVSIVLPTHNGSRYIRRSIQSCLDQSYANLEVIVVDDGSAEDMRSIVREFADHRIRYIRHEKNQGLPAALNTGFAATTGSYLTWTSDDNYYAPHAIERLARFLRRYPHIDFVYSSQFIVDESQQESTRVRRALPPSDLKRQNNIGGSFMYRRQVYTAIGQYDSGAVLVEDYDYWIRVSRRFRMQRILEPLYYYRYHAASLTSAHSKEDVARRVDLVRQKHGAFSAQ